MSQGWVAGAADRDPQANATQFIVAEYQAVRAEIDRRSNAQGLLMNLNLTGVAGLFGFSITQQNSFLLAVIPPFSLTLFVLFLDHTLTIERLGKYSRTKLTPRAQSLSSANVLEWEGWADWARGMRLESHLWRIAQLLAFLGASGVAAMNVLLYADRTIDLVVGVIELMAFFGVSALWVILNRREQRRKQRPEGNLV
jgi:hypothetical protein